MAMRVRPSQRVLDLPVREFTASAAKKVEVLKESQPVKELQIALKKGALAVSVVDDDQKVVGIITRSDATELAKKVKNASAGELLVRDVMTPKPYFAYDNDPIESQLGLMRKMGLITGVPVVDRINNRYCGFLLRHEALLELDRLLGNEIGEYNQPGSNL